MKHFKKYIISFLILFISSNAFSVFANQNVIDSLEKSLSQLDEPESIPVQLELSRLYLTVNLRKSLNYSGRALELSKKYSDEELIARSNLNIANAYFEMSRFQSAIEFYEKALDYYFDQRSPDNKIYIYTRLGDCEKMLSNYNNALFYYQKPLNLYLVENKNKISDAYNNIGIIYKFLNNFDQSMHYHQLALNESNLSNNQQEIANTLKNIGSLYWHKSLYDSSLVYFEKSLELYRELADTLGEANILNNLGTIYKNLGDFQKALDYNKKALELRTFVGKKKEIANSLNSIGSIYLATNDLNNALIFYQNALEIRLEIEDIMGIANSQNNLSLVYRRKDDYNTALEYLNKSLRNYQNIGNKSSIANAINQIGNIQKRLQQYDLALKSYLDAIKIRQEINDRNEIASILLNIGIIYSDIGNYSKALETFNRNLEIKREYGNRIEISYSLHIIGNTHLMLKEYSKALGFYQEALQLRKETGDKMNIATSLKSIGNTQLYLGNYEESIQNLLDAKKMREEIGDVKGTSEVLNDIGNFYIQTKQNEKALENYYKTIELTNKTNDLYLNALSKRKIGVLLIEMNQNEKGLEFIYESLQIGQTIDNLELIKYAYYELFSYYNKFKDKTRALENYINYTTIKDSIDARLNSQRLVEIQMNFELEESQSEISRIENEISQLTAENKIRELELKKQKNVRNLLSIIIILTLGFGGIIFIQYLNKRKTNILLKEKIDEVDQSNRLLKESEENLQILNATKDKFFSIIAHDLRNPFNALHGLTQHLLNNFESFTNEEVKESLDLIYNSADDLLELLENLLHWSRTQRGKIKFSPIEFNLSEMVDKNFNLLSMNAKKKEINLVNEIDDNFLIYADYDMVMAILRNLISNAIKFSHTNSYVRIHADQNNDFYQVSVMDNGIGISKDDISKLFRIDVHYSTSGTSEEQGSGLGLILCKEFVDKHHGKIWVESEPGKGSIFKFTLSKKIENQNG